MAQAVWKPTSHPPSPMFAPRGKADPVRSPADVAFWTQSGHRARFEPSPLVTQSGPRRQVLPPLIYVKVKQLLALRLGSAAL
jgi:hypothetical protein